MPADTVLITWKGETPTRHPLPLDSKASCEDVDAAALEYTSNGATQTDYIGVERDCVEPYTCDAPLVALGSALPCEEWMISAAIGAFRPPPVHCPLCNISRPDARMCLKGEEIGTVPVSFLVAFRLDDTKTCHHLPPDTNLGNQFVNIASAAPMNFPTAAVVFQTPQGPRAMPVWRSCALREEPAVP